jgi:UDPglucose 6-dehydrogenase
MKRNRVAIVGCGWVGKATNKLFTDAVLYDTAPGMPADREAVNGCDVAFVCVPTPAKPDGGCDTAAVEEVVSWLRTPIIVLRSTVPPGTTEALARRHNKRIVFQPEYLGETPAHPLADIRTRDFFVLGGQQEDTAAVAAIYSRVCHSSVRFYFTDSRTAELAKYMENCFFAVKVLFCSEFSRIAEAMGVTYAQLREIWLADPRISRDHTFAYENEPGFGGRCLPKDIAAIIECAKQHGGSPQLLEAVVRINKEYRATAAVQKG